MTVDISKPSETYVLLEGPAVDVYDKDPHKYNEFLETNGNSVSERGGQNTGDKLTNTARKLKHGRNYRGIATIVTIDGIRMAQINLMWDKNSKPPDGLINIAIDECKKVNSLLSNKSKKDIQGYIDEAHDDSELRVVFKKGS